MQAPSYGRQPTWVKGAPLARYSSDAAVCATYWITEQQRGFVPQSLEVSGRTAYVGGYGPSRLRGLGHCQIAVVDTRTGRTRAFQDGVVLPGSTGPRPTRCNHGGGLELTDEGLWIAQRHRVWLLDPGLVGTGTNPVLRMWELARPAGASTLVVHDGRLGVARFRPHRAGRIWWFDLQEVLAPGARAIVRPVEVAAVPQRLQGLTGVGGGMWFNSSTTRCAALRVGADEPLAFVPGSEDVEVVGNDVWTVSESGSKRYFDPGEDAVPGLLRLDRATVLAGPKADCTF